MLAVDNRSVVARTQRQGGRERRASSGPVSVSRTGPQPSFTQSVPTEGHQRES